MRDSIKSKTESLKCPRCQNVIRFMFTEGEEHKCEKCGTTFKRIGPGMWKIKKGS